MSTYLGDHLRGRCLFALLFPRSKVSANVWISPNNAQFLIAWLKFKTSCFALSVQLDLLLNVFEKAALNLAISDILPCKYRPVCFQ